MTGESGTEKVIRRSSCTNMPSPSVYRRMRHLSVLMRPGEQSRTAGGESFGYVKGARLPAQSDRPGASEAALLSGMLFLMKSTG